MHALVEFLCASLLIPALITLLVRVSEVGIGSKYTRDLHSDLPSAMARHSLKLTGKFRYIDQNPELTAPNQLN